MTERFATGERLIRVGAVVTLLGMALTAIAVLPLFTGSPMPSAMWALAMITGVGFALVLAGLWRNARARSVAQRGAGALNQR